MWNGKKICSGIEKNIGHGIIWRLEQIPRNMRKGKGCIMQIWRSCRFLTEVKVHQHQGLLNCVCLFERSISKNNHCMHWKYQFRNAVGNQAADRMFTLYLCSTSCVSSWRTSDLQIAMHVGETCEWTVYNWHRNTNLTGYKLLNVNLAEELNGPATITFLRTPLSLPELPSNRISYHASCTMHTYPLHQSASGQPLDTRSRKFEATKIAFDLPHSPKKNDRPVLSLVTWVSSLLREMNTQLTSSWGKVTQWMLIYNQIYIDFHMSCLTWHIFEFCSEVYPETAKLF